MPSDDPLLAVAGLVVLGAAGVLIQVLVSRKSQHGGQTRARSDLHLRRKAQHAVSGLFIVCARHMADVTGPQLATVLLVLTAALCIIHMVRLRVKRVDRVYMSLFTPILRDHERRALPGSFWFLLGGGLAALAANRAVAMLSMLYLALGDPMASLCGITYGYATPRVPFVRSKSVAGVAGGFAVCAAATLVYSLSVVDVQSHSMSAATLAMFVVLGGLAGAVAEVLPLGVDDNLSIPILSVVLLRGVVWLLQVPLLDL